MFRWHDTPWMWLMMVVFWSVFIVVAYYAIRALTRKTVAERGPRAAEILREAPAALDRHDRSDKLERGESGTEATRDPAPGGTMRDLAERPVRGTTTLSLKQREAIGREGRIARALEAAQRRRSGRFSRTVDPNPTSGGDRHSGRRDA